MKSIASVLEGFKAGKEFGIKVFVLPEGTESQEEQLVGEVLKASCDPKTLLVATGSCAPGERQSIRDALVNGYHEYKGGRGKIASLATWAQSGAGEVADQIGGSLPGLAAKFGLKL